MKSSKERALKALKGLEPDRPPIYTSVTHQVGNMLNDHLGLPLEDPVDSFLSTRVSYTEALTMLGNDFVAVAAGRPDKFVAKLNADGTITDEWGISWVDTGVYSEMADHPLKHAETVADIVNYPFPDSLTPGRFEHAGNQISKYGSDYAIIGEQECTILELSWYLTGLEKFLMDLMMERRYIFELMDRVMEINLQQACKLVDMGVDIVWTGDDIGNQSGMMLDPEHWRRYFKPRMQHVFSTLKKHNPDVLIAYHSCGSILPVIPDLIEIGLDILNPIQPMASGMDATFLKKTYGDRLSFFGGIDIQNILPFASSQEVRAHIREKKNILGKGGGYIIAPAHNIQPDTPLENILAYFDEAKKI